MPIRSLGEDASDKIDKTILDAEQIAENATRRAEQMVQDALEKLRIQGRAYTEEAEKSLEDAQKYFTARVHERPLAAVFAALGLGVAVGLLIGGRRR